MPSPLPLPLCDCVTDDLRDLRKRLTDVSDSRLHAGRNREVVDSVNVPSRGSEVLIARM